MAEADNIDAGHAEGLSTDGRAELVRLRRENRVLSMEIEILERASAYFAREASGPELFTGWSTSSPMTPAPDTKGRANVLHLVGAESCSHLVLFTCTTTEVLNTLAFRLDLQPETWSSPRPSSTTPICCRGVGTRGSGHRRRCSWDLLRGSGDRCARPAADAAGPGRQRSLRRRRRVVHVCDQPAGHRGGAFVGVDHGALVQAVPDERAPISPAAGRRRDCRPRSVGCDSDRPQAAEGDPGGADGAR